VICPKSVKMVWDTECKKYGVPPVDILTPSAIISAVGKWLYGYGEDYRATPAYEELVKQRILLVIDECQFFKNSGTRRIVAIRQMVHEILKQNNGSRIGCLSGTPMDKDEQAVNVLRYTGIMTMPHPYLYDRSEKIYIPQGIKEIIDKAKAFDQTTTDAVLIQVVSATTTNYSSVLDRKNSPKIIAELYYRVFLNRLGGAMPPPPLPRKTFNGFFNVPEHELAELQGLQLRIRQVIKYDEATGAQLGKNTLSQVNKLVHRWQELMVNTAVRRAEMSLQSNENKKIVISANYVKTVLDVFERRLAKYRPLMLSGKVTSDKARAEAVAKFQEPNVNYRLLLMNPNVGGLGISLHDADGRFPREEIILPTYEFMTIHQAAYRVSQPDSKSESEIYIMYPKECPLQLKIYQAIFMKTEAAKKALYDKGEGTVFPGDYTRYEEP